MGIQRDHLQKDLKLYLQVQSGTGSTSQHDSLFHPAGESTERSAMSLLVRALLVVSSRTWYKLAKASAAETVLTGISGQV